MKQDCSSYLIRAAQHTILTSGFKWTLPIVLPWYRPMSLEDDEQLYYSQLGRVQLRVALLKLLDVLYGNEDTERNNAVLSCILAPATCACLMAQLGMRYPGDKRHTRHAEGFLENIGLFYTDFGEEPTYRWVEGNLGVLATTLANEHHNWGALARKRPLEDDALDDANGARPQKQRRTILGDAVNFL